MCLFALRSKDQGHKPLKARKAWKLVHVDRSPFYRLYTGIVYKDGSTHRVAIQEIRKSSRRGSYPSVHIFEAGLHVYRTLTEARHWARIYPDEVIIEVEVSPNDWVAHDYKEAVYRRIKVTGAVK